MWWLYSYGTVLFKELLYWLIQVINGLRKYWWRCVMRTFYWLIRGVDVEKVSVAIGCDAVTLGCDFVMWCELCCELNLGCCARLNKFCALLDKETDYVLYCFVWLLVINRLIFVFFVMFICMFNFLQQILLPIRFVKKVEGAVVNGNTVVFSVFLL